MRSKFGSYFNVGSRVLSRRTAGRCPKLGSLAAVLLGLAFGGAAHAGMITVSASAPTFASGDIVISQPTSVGAANGTYDADNSYHGVGQSFTTGSNAAGYKLKSFTYKLSATNAPTGTFNFEVISLATPNTSVQTSTSRGILASPEGTYTVVGMDTATASAGTSGTWPLGVPANSSAYAGYYVTFKFGTPVSLAANTTYAFDVSGPAYFNVDHAAFESTPVNSNVSEIAINEYNKYGGSVGATGTYVGSGFISNYKDGAGTYNRVFYADTTANPVPATGGNRSRAKVAKLAK